MKNNNQKNLILLIIIIPALSSCMFIKNLTNKSRQLYPITHINEYNVRGIVFTDTTKLPYPSHMYPKKFEKRFSPTFDEILLFEKTFHENYEAYRKRKSFYNPDIEISGEVYKKWGRHYFGYHDEDGQKIILVFFTLFEDRSDKRRWQQGPFVQTPGQWSLFFNIHTKELFDWSID